MIDAMMLQADLDQDGFVNFEEYCYIVTEDLSPLKPEDIEEPKKEEIKVKSPPCSPKIEKLKLEPKAEEELD